MDRRRFVAGMAAASALAACSRGGWNTREGRGGEDAVVGEVAGAHPRSPRFATLGEALAAAPADASRPFRVRIGPGRFHEKLVVSRPHVHLLGAGRGLTRLGFDAAAGQLRPGGEPWGTWGCASLIVRAPGFRARALCIENRFDYLGHLAAPRLQATGPNGPQAVALMVDAGADDCVLEDVWLRGHQDTLFLEAGRSLLRGCRIEGSVDFVFGAGVAWIEACELVSRFRPGKPRQGYVCAPSTPAAQAHGLVFSRCRLLREAGVPDRSVALGRAWRPGRRFDDGQYGDPAAVGAALFLDCWMDAHVDAWDAMAYTARDGTRVMLEPAQARLAEAGSRGPGALESPTRPRLDAGAARALTRGRVLGAMAAG